MKFRKKPVVIEAWQWKGQGFDKWPVWLKRYEVKSHPDEPVGAIVYRTDSGLNLDLIAIPTLEGTMTASPGDWIIRGIKGELYPCKPDIFAATYEPVESTLGGAEPSPPEDEP